MNDSGLNNRANQIRNLLIAIAAVVLSVGIFLGVNTQTGIQSLEAQAAAAVALDEAINNSQPTVTEFYANWCTSCQAMASDLAALKTKYGDRVNFVMLNVDNRKWLPEMLRYRVDGIPHFVFLDRQGNTLAQAIGEQPRTILEANLQALIDEQPLPYATSVGKVSEFDASKLQTTDDDPRSHGGNT